MFQTVTYRYDLRISARTGRRVVSLRKTVGDMIQESAPLPAPEGPLELRIAGDPTTYAFAFRASGETEWTPVGTGLAQLLTAEVACTWTGVFLGLYSSGNGSACRRVADFDWFEYGPE